MSTNEQAEETLRETTWRERQQAKVDVAYARERLKAKEAETDIARQEYWDAMRRESEAIQRDIDAWKDPINDDDLVGTGGAGNTIHDVPRGVGWDHDNDPRGRGQAATPQEGGER